VSPDEAFHAWLRTQFSTLEEAKDWVRRWYQNDQWIPGEEGPRWDGDRARGGGFSMRAMAAHVSMALEGQEYPGAGFGTLYTETKYGPLLYSAMGDPLGAV